MKTIEDLNSGTFFLLLSKIYILLQFLPFFFIPMGYHTWAPASPQDALKTIWLCHRLNILHINTFIYYFHLRCCFLFSYLVNPSWIMSKHTTATVFVTVPCGHVVGRGKHICQLREECSVRSRINQSDPWTYIFEWYKDIKFN